MRTILIVACVICIFIAGYAMADGTAYEKKSIKFVDTIYDSKTFTIKKAYDENSNKIIYIGIGCSVSAVDADDIKEMYVSANVSNMNSSNYSIIKVKPVM